MALTQIKTGGLANNSVTDAKVADAITVTGAQTGITSVGTLTAGTWNAGVIASAYLDADTAHLSTTQTFSGAKTFSSAVNVALSDASVSPSSDADDLVVENNGACGITIASASNSVGSLRFADSGASHAGMIYYSHTSNFMRLYTSATQALEIDSSQNTTFSGDININGSGARQIKFDDGSESEGAIVFDEITDGFIFKVGGTSGSGKVDALHIANNGKVGIGISSPTAPLHIKAAPVQTSGSRSAQLYIEDTTTHTSVQNSGIQFRQQWQSGSVTSTSAIVGTRTSTSSGNYGGALIFQTRANGQDLADNMIIDNDGKIGIGNTSPNYDVHISAPANASLALSSTDRNGHGENWYIKNDDGTLTFISADADYGSSTARLKLYDSGQVDALGIYDAAISGTTRDVSVKNDGRVGYVSSSIRYKKDVKDIADISWIYKLRPVDFKYKEDNSKNWGLIAEEVHEIKPELVSYNDNKEPETVNYSKLSVLLLKAVQEAMERIETLENG